MNYNRKAKFKSNLKNQSPNIPKGETQEKTLEETLEKIKDIRTEADEITGYITERTDRSGRRETRRSG